MLAPGTQPLPFYLDVNFKNQLRIAPVHWGHGSLSQVTYYRTYSRRRGDGRMEDWADCVIRVIEGQWTILRTYARQVGLPWNHERGQRLAQEAATRMHQFKWTPPGRGLWMMGTDYIWQRGSAALNNCAFVSTEAMSPDNPVETIEPFRFLMDVAMLGVGPGFDTRGANKVGIRGFDGSTVQHRIPDSREGWVDAAGLLLRNVLFGGPDIEFNYDDLRAEGMPLKGFGGIASGPLPLVQGLNGIRCRLLDRVGQNFSSVDITDVMNILGKVVVSGNIRRTAEIAFSEPDDAAFRDMKNWEVDPEAVGAVPPAELEIESQYDYDAYVEGMKDPASGECSRIKKKYGDREWAYKFGGWRWASNNSVFAKVGMDYKQFDKPIATAGEPGFIWLDVTRAYGRIKDSPDHKDHRVAGTNPCGEQPLESWELCNLVENFPARATDYWDFQRTLKFSYLYAKTVTLMATHIERSNEVMSRNRRIGCSLSGVADAIHKIGRTTFLQDWCERGYNYVMYLDKKYSEWLGVRESIKRTSEKPSGTVSLVTGAFGPGCHNPKTTGYRTMRIASNSALVPALVAAGHRVEPALTDPTGTVVAYFPWIVPEGLLTDQEVGLWEQVSMAADMQFWWADNQVSYTATFSPDEAERGEISRVLTAFDGRLKGISFLSKAEGTYAQMPFTPAARVEVLAYAARLRVVDFTVLDANHEVEDKFCDGVTCEVRTVAA